jgi:predicted Zn-dependent protease
VHDIADLERRGVVGTFVASSEFVDAAEVQAAALGFDAARVFVPHPIQDRTDDEMVAIADAVVDEVIATVVAGGLEDEP